MTCFYSLKFKQWVKINKVSHNYLSFALRCLAAGCGDTRLSPDTDTSDMLLSSKYKNSFIKSFVILTYF